MNDFHTPVFLKEVIENLKIRKNKKYIDATIGGAGHSFEILKRGGIVLGIDVDQEAVDYVNRRWKTESRRWKIERENLSLVKGNFRDIDKIARLNNFDKVSGVIFDLGVSSHQIDKPERGFSFQNVGPLDMRMDQELGVRALDLIKILTKGELYEIFTKFGEENRAWTISERIVSARKMRSIETTKDLASIVESVDRKGATSANARASADKKIFQALRIVVNDELNAIQVALPKAVRLLERWGILAVISFHSLEDRIVKREFIKFEEKKMGTIVAGKPIVPTIDEIKKNRRSRSAKLRIFETRSTS